MYIADANNNRIRRVGPDSIITTYAGSGNMGFFEGGFSENGDPATQARLNVPTGVVVDAQGVVYIADGGNNRIRRVGADGIITDFAGRGPTGIGEGGFSGDGGAADQAFLDDPRDMALDANGNVYIADKANHRIRRVDPDGIITTFAGTGDLGFSGDGGRADQALLVDPTGVAVGADGSVYIADSGNHRIRRVDPDGIITTFAGSGATGTGDGGFSGDGGAADQAVLNEPRGVAVDAQGNVYITDSGNRRVRRVATDGIITTFAGSGVHGSSGDGGPAVQARLIQPFQVAVDAEGNVYIADTGSNCVRRVDTDSIITSFAGTGRPGGFSGDGGPADQAGLSEPTGVAVAVDGSVYIADKQNHRIRRVSPDGVITTFSGSGATGIEKGGFSGDGRPADQAVLNEPWGVAVAVDGSVYIADKQNHRIRRVSSDGVITTFAGGGSPRYPSVGDGGPADQAGLFLPQDVAVDSNGNVYIADSGNHRIRRVDTERTITTFAGTGDLGSSGDGGPAAQAAFFQPSGVAVDANGNVYITDTFNHRIRWVGNDGIINTFAGTGSTSFSGDGGPATQASLSNPRDVAVDPNGNVYIADGEHFRIRRVDSDGIITTLAGSGPTSAGGFSGDGGPAVQARLMSPSSLALDVQGFIYVADWGNHRIRRIALTEVFGPSPADFDNDGDVDFDDFFEFAAAFGQPAAGEFAKFDLDGAGDTIDFDDFFAFAAEFGS